MLFGHTDPTQLYHLGQAAATAAAGLAGWGENYSGSVPGKPALVVTKACWSDVSKTARFRIDVVDQVTAADADLPTSIAFAQIIPNPARVDAALRFDLPREAHIDLAVYDIGGRRVSTLSNGTWNAGRHTIRWVLSGDDGQPLPSGMYLVRFRWGNHQATQRVLVVR